MKDGVGRATSYLGTAIKEQIRKYFRIGGGGRQDKKMRVNGDIQRKSILRKFSSYFHKVF